MSKSKKRLMFTGMPTADPIGAADFSQKRFDDLSKHLLRVALVLVSFAFFCFLSLTQADAVFIKSTGSVRVPFANVDVDCGAFFVVGPLVLCGMLMYLHILLGEWEQLATKIN